MGRFGKKQPALDKRTGKPCPNRQQDQECAKPCSAHETQGKQHDGERNAQKQGKAAQFRSMFARNTEAHLFLEIVTAGAGRLEKADGRRAPAQPHRRRGVGIALCNVHHAPGEKLQNAGKRQTSQRSECERGCLLS
jgi:hypothetical protein